MWSIRTPPVQIKTDSGQQNWCFSGLSYTYETPFICHSCLVFPAAGHNRHTSAGYADYAFSAGGALFCRGVAAGAEIHQRQSAPEKICRGFSGQRAASAKNQICIAGNGMDIIKYLILLQYFSSHSRDIAFGGNNLEHIFFTP